MKTKELRLWRERCRIAERRGDLASNLIEACNELDTLEAKVQAQAELLERAKEFVQSSRMSTDIFYPEGRTEDVWLSDYDKLKARRE